MTILGRLHVERFKSLYDVDVELGHINVFIGANGSGKSNLLASPLPGNVLIAIPVMATEAWVLAALFPRLRNLESETAPAQVLVDKGKIEMGRTGPWKRVKEYRVFADAVATRLKHVREACAEAARFVTKLERASATLAK